MGHQTQATARARPAARVAGLPWLARHASLRMRLFAGLLVLGLLSGAVGALAVRQVYAFADRAAVAEAERVANAVAVAVQGTLEQRAATGESLDSGWMQRYVERLYREQKRDLEVISPNRTILADVHPEHVGRVSDSRRGDELELALADGQPRTFWEVSADYPRGIREIVVPVRGSTGASVGAVILEYTPFLEDLRAEAGRTAWAIAAISGAAVALALALGWFLARSITRPLTDLTRAAMRLARGAWDTRAAVRSRDEVGLLAQAFNRMATDLQTSHEALASANERLERILLSAGEAIVGLDGTGRVTFTNPATSALLGYLPEELLGQPLHDLVHRDGCPASGPGEVPCPLRDALAVGSLQGEAELTRKDGSAFPALFTSSPARREPGGPASLVVTLADVSERRAAEEERLRLEIRAQEARLEVEAARQLAEARAVHEAAALHLADGLALIDAAGRVSFWNQRLEELYGVAADRVLGKLLEEVTDLLYAATPAPAEARRRSDEARAAALATGEPVVFEYRRPGQDGAMRDLQVLVFRIDGPDGQPLGHGRLVRDVTEERSLARMKDELVSVVSHELRTPMAAIVGFSELLLTRDYAEAARREYLGTILAEGKRLTALINDFLDLQRMGHGHLALDAAPLDARAAAERAIRSIGEDEARPIVLACPARLARVSADSERLHQVLMNVLSNARKYSPGGGTITLSLRNAGSLVEAAVQDQGLGIPAEALPCLFQEFYRVSGKERQAISGTGLGLAICRQIVEAHGGRIWAESPGPGQGTTVRFTLPVAARAALATRARRQSASGARAA